MNELSMKKKRSVYDFPLSQIRQMFRDCGAIRVEKKTLLELHRELCNYGTQLVWRSVYWRKVMNPKDRFVFTEAKDELVQEGETEPANTVDPILTDRHVRFALRDMAKMRRERYMLEVKKKFGGF